MGNNIKYYTVEHVRLVSAPGYDEYFYLFAMMIHVVRTVQWYDTILFI